MERRWSQHIIQAKHSVDGRWHFPNAIRKYGKDAFSHEVLQICNSLEEANKFEEEFIKKFDTRNPEKGFNISRGGAHVPHPIKKNPWNNPEFRLKVSSSMKKKWQDPAYRLVASLSSQEVLSRPEVRQKLSEATTFQFSQPGVKEKLSKTISDLHKNPEYTIKSMSGFKKMNEIRSSKTHCKNGHEFTLENTRYNGKFRQCKKCSSIRTSQREYDKRTHCKNGHEFILENIKFIKGSRKRICIKCVVIHCKKGHEFTLENTNFDKRGSKVCILCRQFRGRKSDAKRRAKKRNLKIQPFLNHNFLT
jgi:hypothetical protein